MAFRGKYGFVSDKYLTDQYANLNHKFFFGMLPSCKVGWATRRKFSSMDCDPDQLGVTLENNQGVGILIGDFQARWSALVKMVLLHEMVHVKLSQLPAFKGKKQSHGRSFQREMNRLAKRGAFADAW